MQRKDILELRKRLKKDDSTFTNLSGCYVSGEKEIISKFSEFFLNLDDDELFKYLEIAKKVLSGNLGNNILKLNFPLDEDFTNEKQTSLMELSRSGLKDNDLLDAFYELVIDHYEYEGNFLILVFHDAYDIMTKTTDNQTLDDSEEVYEYILCAICPVSLSDAGLKYYEDENTIKSLIRDWVVGLPTNGFIFPGFVDRSSDINSVIYYTKKPKDPHPELMEEILGCTPKQTTTIQKETFQSIVKESLDVEEEQAEMVFMDVHENLNTMITEYKSLYEDREVDPITLTKDHVQEILIDSGIPEEATVKIEDSYTQCFGDDLPLAEGLIDKKVLKASAQVQKEKSLLKHINILETKLEAVSQQAPLDDEDENSTDIILQVKPEKVSQIKSQMIDGQRCIVIPIDEDETARVNGLDDIIT